MYVSIEQKKQLKMISELMKIVLEQKNDSKSNLIFKELSSSFKKNIYLDLKYQSKRDIDHNLAVLSASVINKLQETYTPYTRVIKRIYKEEKNTVKEMKLKKAKEILKSEIAKIESLVFAYTIDGNKEFFKKLDKNKTTRRYTKSKNDAFNTLINYAKKFPLEFLDDLVPLDREIVPTLSHHKTKTPKELAIKYAEILFTRLGYNIGSDTNRRKIKLEPTLQIDITENEINDFLKLLKSV